MNPPKLRWVAFGAAVTFLIAVLLTSFFKELEKIDVLASALDKRMEELVAEERRTQKLKQDIRYYSTPEGIERLAVEQFNLVRSGDRIYKIEVTPQRRARCIIQNCVSLPLPQRRGQSPEGGGEVRAVLRNGSNIQG